MRAALAASCPTAPRCGARSGRLVCRAARSAPRSPPKLPSNDVGIHSQVWVGGWNPQQAETSIAGTKKAGYDLIELNLSEPDDFDVETTKALLKKYDLRASGSLGLTKATDVSSPDKAVREAGKDLLKKSMKILHACGGKFFVGVNYCAMDKYREPCTSEQWNACVGSIRELADVAADLGIEYGLEVVNRYETNIANTGAQAMELVADIDRPNVFVHLDTHHMNIEEADFVSACKVCGDRLRYVHIGESHRGYLGTGSVPWEGFWRGLAEMGYDGPLTFESFSSVVASKSLSNTLCVWRDLWVDSEDLATSARSFIDAGLRVANAVYV